MDPEVQLQNLLRFNVDLTLKPFDLVRHEQFSANLVFEKRMYGICESVVNPLSPPLPDKHAVTRESLVTFSKPPCSP